MAVIRQKTQFINRPVGVVRASEGGQRIGQAISSGASALANDFFREAAVVAEETGQKEAMAQSSEDIVSIDPETGNPVAYKPPSSYGSIASRSYQNLIDRRFQESVIEEIKEKGAEFAASSSSAASYKGKMSQYIGEMYKSAVSEDGELNAYGRQIKEAGEKYVASTYATLRKKEIAAYKKRVNRANKLAAYRAQVELDASIASNQDPQLVSDMIDAEMTRNEDMLSAGGSVSDYIKIDKKLRGQRDLIGSRKLVGIYSNASEEHRLLIEQAIANPNKTSEVSITLGVDNLGVLIAQAGGSENASTILAGLRSSGEIENDLKEAAVSNGFQDLEIEWYSNINDLNSAISSLDEPDDVKKDIREDVYQSLALKTLDSLDLTSDEMSVIANELKSESFSFEKVKEAAFPTINAENQQKLVNAMMSLHGMSSEGRVDLAKLLTDRQSDLRSIEASQANAADLAMRKSIVGLELSQDLLRDYSDLKDGAATLGLTNFLDENFVANAMIEQRLVSVSADTYEDVKNAVESGVPLDNPSLVGKYLYGLLNTAYKLNRTSVSGEMSARLGGLNDVAKKSVDDVILTSIKDAAIDGKPLQSDELDLLDQDIFGDEPFFLQDLSDYPEAMQIFNAGTVLPTIRIALSSALDSNSEAEIEAAAIMFRQGSTAQGTLASGEAVNINLMRSSLSQEDYGLFSAMLYANEKTGDSPTSIIATLRNYEGNLDEDLVQGITGKVGGNVSSILEGTPMSPNYKREIIASLRLAKAKGGIVNRDTVDRLIDNYSKFTKKDNAVYGPFIGDKTVYARSSYFSSSEIIQNERDLTDALVDSDVFSDLTRGGTNADAIIGGVQDLNPFAMFASSRGLIASMFGNMETLSEEERKIRLRKGLATIGVDLKYRPNIQSFKNGVPSYDVGYDDGMGFQPFIINNEVWTLTDNPRPSRSRGDARYQSLRVLRKASTSGASVEAKYSAEINYLATLDYMTLDSFKSSNRYRKMKQDMTQDPVQLFEEAKSKYMELPLGN